MPPAALSIGIDNDPFQVGAVNLTPDNNRGAVCLAVAEEAYVGDVLDGVEVDKILNVCQLLAVVFSDLTDDFFRTLLAEKFGELYLK